MSIGFQVPASWKEKVLSADNIWSQVQNILDQNGVALPETSRRPDVRMILNNDSNFTRMFANPGNHSNDKAEVIPAFGDKTAAMIMVAGETLEEQNANADQLFKKFNLGQEGLSASFIQALMVDGAGGLVKEAYGPAPFEGQASKLVDIDWHNADGNVTNLTPVFGQAGAYGTRAATNEMAINATVHVFVQGTDTVAELIESPGMVIAVSSDWETQKISTRPIVASVAREFYGEGYAHIPEVTVHPDGYVTKIDLKNGTVFEMTPNGNGANAAAGLQSPTVS